MSNTPFARALRLLYQDPARVLSAKLSALPRRFLPQSPKGLVQEGLPEAAGAYLDNLVAETGCPRQFASLLAIRALFSYTNTIYEDADKLDAYLEDSCAAWPARRWEPAVLNALRSAYDALEPEGANPRPLTHAAPANRAKARARA